ncbi:MAG TPA: hypothetical protein VH596_13960 [Terriglobales bacterium]|jgi:hypothetical protein
MRALIVWFLVVLIPLTIFGADMPSGVIYGTGSVYLDGSLLGNSMPVSSGDVVETKDVSGAHVDLDGSTVMIQSNAIVRVKEGGMALDRGSVSVGTRKSISVFARDFQITPTSSDWTQFEVARSSGLIHISAIKNDVEIKCGAQVPTVIREGHDLTRADAQNCGMVAQDQGAPTPMKEPILASPWAKGAGLAAAGSIIGWMLSQTGAEPISPDQK